MARPPKGKELLEQAKEALSKAKTADELREVQAVVLPLEMGLTLKQTAEATGRSVRWVSQARRGYLEQAGSVLPSKPGKGGRRRQNMSPEAEARFLAPFLEEAKHGGVLVVNDIHRALQDTLGRKVALSSAYNLLHRHGWRKLAPLKRHVEADVAAQEDWKKNSASESVVSHRDGRKKRRKTAPCE